MKLLLFCCVCVYIYIYIYIISIYLSISTSIDLMKGNGFILKRQVGDNTPQKLLLMQTTQMT